MTSNDFSNPTENKPVSKCPYHHDANPASTTSSNSDTIPQDTLHNNSATLQDQTENYATALSGSAVARKISRRAMLIGSGTLTALGIGLGAVGGYTAGSHYGIAKAQPSTDLLRISHPFRGKHQSGILTAQQQQMHTAAFDVTTKHKEMLIRLLEKWTLAAERMMAGDLIGEYKTFRDVPPDDTGEAADVGPAALTITFGFGASLFDHPEYGDRFGIASRMPQVLRDGIPRMSSEKIDPQASHGDLIIQACAEDPMVAMHAIHNLTRIAFGTATVRWSQLGYGRTSSTSNTQKTPRNLFGFKDGTNNIRAEEPESELNTHLWIQPGDPGGEYCADGTYLCIRKIKQFMEVWDELILSEQENIIGRDKITGAPLSGGDEFTPPDFEKTDENGKPLIDPDSHVAVVHPSHNKGARMLRRGYNYMQGNDKIGRLEGGLFFVAFVRDPSTNFIPVLTKMRRDLMTEYLQHLATGLYLIPGGIREGDRYVGERILS